MLSQNELQRRKLKWILIPIGISSCFCSMFCALLFFTKQIRNNQIISSILINHLELLLKKDPSNTIIRFLLENTSIITKNIEQSYVIDKLYLYLAIAAVTSLVAVTILLGYEARKLRGYKKEEIHQSIKEDLKPNVLLFGVAFFGTLTFLALSALIPLLAVTPRKLSTLICEGIDYINHKDNALVEVLKDIINHTFHDENLVTNIKNNVSKVFIIFVAASTVLLLTFVVIGLMYYIQCNNQCNKLTSPEIQELESNKCKQIT